MELQVKHKRKTLGDISDYYAAKKRFQISSEENNLDDSTTDSSDISNQVLNDDYARMILSICDGLDHPTKDMDFMFNMLIHSDYIQLKNDILEHFYDRVVAIYFRTNSILFNIRQNLEKLRPIPHVKSHLGRALLRSLNMIVIKQREHPILILENQKGYHRDFVIESDFNDINCVELYKIKLEASNLSDQETDRFRLNLLLNLFNADEIIFNRCAFNMIHNQESSSMYSVDRARIIFRGLIDRLRKLHFINMNLSMNMLRVIRKIPLKTLNFCGCVGVEGFRYKKPNYKYLLEGGILRETITNLQISPVEPGLELSQLPPITDLNDHSDYSSNGHYTNAESFKQICNLRLEMLETGYHGDPTDNFSSYHNGPLTKTLKKFVLFMNCKSPNFSSYISSIELEYFDFTLSNKDAEFDLDSFLYDFVEQRKHLKTLILNLSRAIHTLTPKFIQGLGMLNITKLNITLPRGQAFRSILALPNLQKTLRVLKLRGEDVLDDDDFKNIQKFVSLRVLEFDYDVRMSEEFLSAFMDTVGMITIKAWYRPSHLETPCKLISLKNIITSKGGKVQGTQECLPI